jgi:hypothetical protein
MKIELNGREMLKLTAISDETGSPVEHIARDAIRSFLNRCPDENLPALNVKESTADALANMVGAKSKIRYGIK